MRGKKKPNRERWEERKTFSFVKDSALGGFSNPFISNIAPQLMASEDFSFQSQTLLQFRKFLLPLHSPRDPLASQWLGSFLSFLGRIKFRWQDIVIQTLTVVPDGSAGRQATGSTQSIATHMVAPLSHFCVP